MKKLILASVLSLNASLSFAHENNAILLIENRHSIIQSTCTYLTSVDGVRQYIKVERYLKPCEKNLKYNSKEGVVKSAEGKYIAKAFVMISSTRTI